MLILLNGMLIFVKWYANYFKGYANYVKWYANYAKWYVNYFKGYANYVKWYAKLWERLYIILWKSLLSNSFNSQSASNCYFWLAIISIWNKSPKLYILQTILNNVEVRYWFLTFKPLIYELYSMKHIRLWHVPNNGINKKIYLWMCDSYSDEWIISNPPI